MGTIVPDEPASAADRWALSVLSVTTARSDPRTLAKWARLTNRGIGTIRMHCYAAGVSPRASLNFARLLRAVRLSERSRWEPERWLDVADLRTLRRLLRVGGLSVAVTVRPTVEEFMTRQRLVAQESAPFRALRRRLASAGRGG